MARSEAVAPDAVPGDIDIAVFGGNDIAALGADDVDACLALSDAAGWNQTGDDWAFFLGQGHAIGCRDGAGGLVATAAALPYGDALGWISMVLVAPSHRHRGLATALLDECIRWLAANGRVAVLDATPAGEPVYRRLGFATGFAFSRWQGAGGTPMMAVSSDDRGDAQTTAATATDADDIVAIDACAGPAPRTALLRAFLARPGSRAWLSRGRGGFVLARAGRRATQIGPLVAASDAQAGVLLATAVDASHGPVFIDVPERSTVIAGALQHRGFTRQRSFARMALGGGAVLVASERVHALAGPEFG